MVLMQVNYIGMQSIINLPGHRPVLWCRCATGRQYPRMSADVSYKIILHVNYVTLANCHDNNSTITLIPQAISTIIC